MSQPVRVIRRTDLQAIADPETQLWPVTAVLLILAGFTAGVIIAKSDFEAQVWHEGGWFRLGALAVTVVVLLGSAALARGKVLMRVQVAILITLLFHLSFLLVMHEVRYAVFNPEKPPEAPLPVDEELTTLPDYGVPVHDEVPTEDPFEKPIETKTPDKPVDELQKQDVPKEEPKKEPTPDPMKTEPLEPQPIKLERAEVSAPRQAEELAGVQISRQEQERPVEQEQQVTPEQVKITEQATAGQPHNAPAVEVERQVMQQQAKTRETNAAAPLAPETTPTVQIKREMARNEPVQQPSESVQVSRQTTTTPELRRPDAVSNVALAPLPTNNRSDSQSASPTAAANAGQVAKSAAASTNAAKPTQRTPGGMPSATAAAASGVPQTAPVARADDDRGMPAATAPGVPGSLARAELAAGTAGPGAGEPSIAAGQAPSAQPTSGQRPSPTAGLVAAETGVARQATGQLGSTNVRPTGNPIPGAVGAPSSGTSLPSGGRPTRATEGEGTTTTVMVGNAARSGLPKRSMGDLALPSGTAPIDQIGTALPSPAQRSGAAGIPDQPNLDGPARRESGVPVQVAALPGPGGLAVDKPSLEIGLPDRRAKRDSDVAKLEIARFILEKTGGQTRTGANQGEEAVPTYMLRAPEFREKVAQQFGGTPESEKAVEAGLEFLARHQSADGHWSLHAFESDEPIAANVGRASIPSDTAGTGLALLAFLGAGYDHQDGKYKEVVSRGLTWLIRNQKPDGDLFTGSSERSVWLYSHGIASIPLCEAYAMTRDPELREPVQRALRFVLTAQDLKWGGWRYEPGRQTDTSVTGWQMMALKSGELSGFLVPGKAFDGVGRWLDFAEGPGRNPARYAYLPAVNALAASDREVSAAMTAEALLMRLYMGWKRDNPYLRDGAEFLRVNLPPRTMFEAGKRDCYYWYYATQVMYQMQGKYWEDWNGRLRDLLVNSQVKTGPLSGSWDPRGDKWGVQGGRIYVTCMHLLMLEVYYRHLPLFRLGEGEEAK